VTTNPLLQLDEALRTGPLVAVIGAGASRTVGYPLWPALIDQLHDEVESRMPGAGEGEPGSRSWVRASPRYVEQLRKMDDLLWRAEEYRRLLDEVDPGIFPGLIGRVFAPERGSPPGNGLIDAIVALPFRHVLNTNYDPSLELAYAGQERRVVEWSNRAQVQEFLGEAWSNSGAAYLVYLHGVHSQPESVVLTERDYVSRYLANDDAAKKLFALFITYRMVFIGFSLSDPELVYLLRVANAQLGSAKPRHFAFMPRQEGHTPDAEEAIRSTYRGKYGVEPIFYDTADGHIELVHMLRSPAPENGAEREMLMAAPAAGVPNPDDPQKGRFGGEPSANGLTLRAEVEEDRTDPGWFHIALTVEAGPGRVYDGNVVFHLHPTFPRSSQTMRMRGGRARLERWAYGAFTVGVEADDGTRLELDLAELPDAPPLFRSR
jgi:hypothetical protein